MKFKIIGIIGMCIGGAFLLFVCGGLFIFGGIDLKVMVDSFFSVMEVDRIVYTRLIIGCLVKEEKVIKVLEYWKDEKVLVLFVQMFCYGAECVVEKGVVFSYLLLLKWSVNKQNKFKIDMEIMGFDYIVVNLGKNFYGEEELGGVKYFIVVYLDVVVSPVCILCYNKYKDSLRSDFKLGEVMGGVVI